MKKLLGSLHTPLWLYVLLAIVFILRIPNFFEPYSYGDEMIYLTLGEAIRKGVPLYSQIHDNKPPLLYIMAAIAGNLFLFKAILTVWMIITVYIFWKLTEILFPKNIKFQITATSVFAIFTTIPLFEGNIVNAELFMIGPTILAFIILLTKSPKFKWLFTSGVLFSISSLFKIPSAFDILAALFLLLITIKKISYNNISKLFKQFFFLSVGFLVPILITFIWYFFQGAFKEYLIAAFLQNVGYLSSFRPGDTQKPFIIRNLPLFIRSGTLAVSYLFLFAKRKVLSKEFLFATAWLLASLFAVTLSERPYPHYLIQSVPAISILIGIFFSLNTIEQILVITPLSLAFFVPVYFHFWHYPTLPYYQKFLKYTQNKTTKSQYFDSFGSQTERNYEISSFIIKHTKPDEKIFVWGDTSTIYALTKRLPPLKYVADYHIKDFADNSWLIDQLIKNPPSYIVIMPKSNEPSQLKAFIFDNYGLVDNIQGAHIWKLLGSRVRSLLSK